MRITIRIHKRNSCPKIKSLIHYVRIYVFLVAVRLVYLYPNICIGPKATLSVQKIMISKRKGTKRKKNVSKAQRHIIIDKVGYELNIFGWTMLCVRMCVSVFQNQIQRICAILSFGGYVLFLLMVTQIGFYPF